MATHLPVIGGHAEGFGKTTRTDGWWKGPAVTFFVFSTFIVYTTWAALQGKYYYSDPYLSPFYSPVLFYDPHAIGGVDHGWFGTIPSFLPRWIPGVMSPARLVCRLAAP